MAISHKARYCNGFPNLVSDIEVLSRSIESIHSRSFLSFLPLSGHKIGHSFSGRDRSPAVQARFFSQHIPHCLYSRSHRTAYNPKMVSTCGSAAMVA